MTSSRGSLLVLIQKNREVISVGISFFFFFARLLLFSSQALLGINSNDGWLATKKNSLEKAHRVIVTVQYVSGMSGARHVVTALQPAELILRWAHWIGNAVAPCGTTPPRGHGHTHRCDDDDGNNDLWHLLLPSCFPGVKAAFVGNHLWDFFRAQPIFEREWWCAMHGSVLDFRGCFLAHVAVIFYRLPSCAEFRICGRANDKRDRVISRRNALWVEHKMVTNDVWRFAVKRHPLQ